jgi:hypothetical protein
MPKGGLREVAARLRLVRFVEVRSVIELLAEDYERLTTVGRPDELCAQLISLAMDMAFGKPRGRRLRATSSRIGHCFQPQGEMAERLPRVPEGGVLNPPAGQSNKERHPIVRLCIDRDDVASISRRSDAPRSAKLHCWRAATTTISAFYAAITP